MIISLHPTERTVRIEHENNGRMEYLKEVLRKKFVIIVQKYFIPKKEGGVVVNRVRFIE